MKMLVAASLWVALLSCREVDLVARHDDRGLLAALCSGHGTWEVTDAGSRCRCESGFISRNAGSCEAIGPRTGCDNAWCASGEVCEVTSGRCVTVAPDHCGQSPEPIGTSVDACASDRDAGAESYCLAGFVCVNQFTAVLPDSGVLAWSGHCLEACDPCAPSCSSNQCVALPGRGGFCAPARLSALGERCLPGVCGGGLTCTAERECQTPCVPDDPAHQNVTTAVRVYHGFPSQLCAANELCKVTRPSIYGNSFACAGPIAQIGGPCVGVCPFPAQCDVWGGDEVVERGVCSYDCSKMPCPEGIDCFKRSDPASQKPIYSCIRDDALELRQLCAEDRNCASSLVCLAVGVGSLRCLPPPP